MTIRKPDPEIKGPTLAYGPYSSAEACRRALHLAYRDCETVFDITYGDGKFWQVPYPPGIKLETNNPDMSVKTTHHLTFADIDEEGVGIPDKTYDLVVYDPPHLADGGKDGIMANRYGTERGTEGLHMMIEDGMGTACRLAKIGVLAKIADHAHGGQWLTLSRWVTNIAMESGFGTYFVMHTYRSTFMDDPKWTIQRVPRSNGAVYLAFRRGPAKHINFDELYERRTRKVVVS
jgi:hypothetical protein